MCLLFENARTPRQQEQRQQQRQGHQKQELCQQQQGQQQQLRCQNSRDASRIQTTAETQGTCNRVTCNSTRQHLAFRNLDDGLQFLGRRKITQSIVNVTKIQFQKTSEILKIAHFQSYIFVSLKLPVLVKLQPDISIVVSYSNSHRNIRIIRMLSLMQVKCGVMVHPTSRSLV